MSSSSRSRALVALLIETSNAYSRGLLRGIRTFIREGADWEVHCSEQGRGDVPPPWFIKWSGAGIIARIENRLSGLSKPIGIFACYDIRGQQLLEICRQESLEVPDEIAVVGHHDDELLCELCDPPLSSVIPNPRRAGYEAAVPLDKLMRGMPVARETVRIDPLERCSRKN
jgi:DNA-binding LacI/PurR family transcriptional regulator